MEDNENVAKYSLLKKHIHMQKLTSYLKNGIDYLKHKTIHNLFVKSISFELIRGRQIIFFHFFYDEHASMFFVWKGVVCLRYYFDVFGDYVIVYGAV